MNTICLIGRLTKEPELRSTQNGNSVCNVSIAVDRGYGDNKTTDFIPLVAWNKTAEFMNKYFAKGQKIAVTGTLTTRQYEDRDGNKRTAFEVLVNNTFFCESNNSQQTEKTAQNQNEGFTERNSNTADDPFGVSVDAFEEITFDDVDLPF